MDNAKEKKAALHTAGLVVIQENKLLLAFSNNKKAWYLPGGKIDAGETPVEALQREIQEELGSQIPVNYPGGGYNKTVPVCPGSGC